MRMMREMKYKGVLIETIPYGIGIDEEKMEAQIEESDFLFTMPFMDIKKIKKIVDMVLEANGKFVYIRRYCAKKHPYGDTNFGVKNLPIDYAYEIKKELELEDEE
jgi:hypothetical protein